MSAASSACWVGDALLSAFGAKGAPLLLLAMFLIAVTLATGLSWFGLMDWTGRAVLRLAGWFGGKLHQAPQVLAARQARTEREVVKKADAVRQAKREPVRIEAPPAPVVKSERARLETQIPLFVGAATPGELPPLSLLDEAPPQGPGYSEETLEVLSRQVEFKLKDFKIEAKVVGAYPGPVITRFEMEPAAGRSRFAGVEPGQGHRPRPVRGQRARGRRDPGQERDRAGDPQYPQADRLPVGDPAFGQVRPAEVAAGAGAGQGHRRQAGGGRPGQDAASAGGRHHRLGQVGGGQRDGAEPAVQGQRRKTCG